MTKELIDEILKGIGLESIYNDHEADDLETCSPLPLQEQFLAN